MDKKKRPAAKGALTRTVSARKALLRWHVLHGRHDLPWRIECSPYAVLVSEFMLQQTTVATVTPRFHSWMNRFPTIDDLALAEEQEVLAAWEGLGYYSRARRLHRTAHAIVENHAGVLPDDEASLLNLPGVGTYTAAALLAFAYDKSALVLDTNIIRVLARWDNLTEPVDTLGGRERLNGIAASFFPRGGSRSVASSLMDLGAMVCTAAAPDCPACPLRKTCLAVAPETLPKKSPRTITTRLIEHRGWVLWKGRLYLEQSSGPRWRGLWILPELGGKKPNGRIVAEITYPITRYRVTMKVYPVASKGFTRLKGFTPKELERLPIPSPMRKVIRRAIAAAEIPSHTSC